MSQRIVDFIAQLQPLYTYQHADGYECALSLIDGSLIMPLDESHAEQEEGWVAVFWQGDSRRRSEVPGVHLASQAVLRYVELRGIGHEPVELGIERVRLAERFRHSTGMSLYLEPALV
ncbi:hypothetical protein DVJ77_15795 [Dyella tabacisoli]|uniref:Uncharacterized protein n=1 Tax=Dyella tabacisoli TaxID=2282381 RepID=A0A369UL22_9GAMM|nr:hypothetical protein DVJ77_15795 [Dyella tabacisoli]